MLIVLHHSRKILRIYLLLASTCALLPWPASVAQFVVNPGGGNADDEGLISPDIIGGTPADAGAYPSYAFWPGDPERSGIPYSRCGASVIHDDVLLSAAHCYPVFPEGQKICIGGIQVDCSDASDIRTVAQIYPLPDYNGENFKNDIMLVKLDSNTSAPSLDWNTKASVPEDNSVVTAIGLGRTAVDGDPSDFIPGVLQEVNLTVLGNEVCEEFFRGLFFSEATICVGGISGEATCFGDS